MENAPLLFGFIAGFTLFLFVSMTSFVKLSVVFLIIRQALGMQQVPSNMVIMALAVFISAFISKPMLVQSISTISETSSSLNESQDYIDLLSNAVSPFREFIVSNTDSRNLVFFTDIASELWIASGTVAEPDDIMIQIPAFLISELTEAFQIGFLLYLPFIAIDLAVTGVLMALGMQQVQPNILSVPFKLLIFVVVDGWVGLIEGLIMTYSGG